MKNQLFEKWQNPKIMTFQLKMESKLLYFAFHYYFGDMENQSHNNDVQRTDLNWLFYAVI